MNGAAVVAEILKREGTEFLSCYPRNPLIEACAALDIRPILCRQERVGVGIADGYLAHQARQAERRVRGAGRPRHRERVPGRRAGLHGERAAADHSRRACRWHGNTCTRCSAPPTSTGRSPNGRRSPTSVQELPDLMRRAYHAHALAARAGPVLVEIPDEVFEAEFRGELDYAPVPVQRDRRPIRTRCARRRRCCWRRKNPLILGRPGRALRRGRRPAAALAELIPAPVATTNPGKSAIPESHPLSLGASTRSRPKMFTDFMAKADRGAGDRLEPDPDAVRARRAARQDHHPFDQRRRRHQQGVPRRSCGGRRRRAGARCADRGGRPAEGAGRRQCAHLAQGGGRGGQEGLARRMGEVSRLRRDRRSTSTA